MFIVAESSKRLVPRSLSRHVDRTLGIFLCLWGWLSSLFFLLFSLFHNIKPLFPRPYDFMKTKRTSAGGGGGSTLALRGSKLKRPRSLKEMARVLSMYNSTTKGA
jgi:hypothetical protein